MQWKNKRITSGLVVKQGIYQVNHPDVQELVLVKKEAEEAQARKTAFKLYKKHLGIYKCGIDVLSTKNKDKRWSVRQFMTQFGSNNSMAMHHKMLLSN